MDGVVNLLKPPGMTSSNAVYDVRRIFQEKRAGHLGTLDPGAAGVLPICIGRATRLFEYLVDKEKEYIFEIAFGMATDTQDVFGRITERSREKVSREMLADALPSFLGRQMQRASVYSALKVDGKKMCDLARAGQEVSPKEREIEIFALDYLEQTEENRFLLKMRCSRGTYVRSLCMDLGEKLGVCAHMSFLLRTASGPFRAEDAISVGELEEKKADGSLCEAVVSCEKALAFLPPLKLPKSREVPAINGLETHLSEKQKGDVRLYAGDRFLGIGHAEGDKIKLTVHLYE